MSVLVTGVSGTLGNNLIQKLRSRYSRVYGLSRKRNDETPCYYLVGDITQENLGLDEDINWDFDACYHLAGIVNLSAVDRDDLIQNTNLFGTANVVKFCQKYHIPHLYYCSTAFTFGRNPYEISKGAAERMVECSEIPKVTIFKPSLVLGSDKQHFSAFVSLLILFHRRAEIIRRRIEGTLRLPVIEPKFRIKGDPDGHLNLITVDAVTEAMMRMTDPGKYWLTNPHPLTLQELGKIVGDFCLMNIDFQKDYAATPLESAFHKIIKSFTPYLNGDEFPSDLPDFVLKPEDINQALINVLH